MRSVRVLRHSADEALGHLEVVLRCEGIALEVVDCFAPEWTRYDRAGFDPADYAGLIVMGGTMNVDQTDRYPFLATEPLWLRRAIDAQLPILGICLGAQLLAKALGARVYKNPVQEIGWYQIEILDDARADGLLGGGQPRQTVFHWHGDTFDLPQGAVLLARGETCAHQAFRFGSRAYGLQFHPEITAPMVDDWLHAHAMCGDLDGLDYIDPAEIRRLTPESLAAMRPFSERVFTRFAAWCRQRH